MKIIKTDAFLKSLEKLAMQKTWWYKIWDAISYKIPFFIKNIWNFRKFLWRFRPNSYHEVLFGMRESLFFLLKNFNTSKEIKEHKDKKIEKIKRVIEILDNIIDDKYFQLSENKFENIYNKDITNIIEYKIELEKNEWNELFTILKGQDIQEIIDIEEIFTKKDLYNDWFDGSGMRGWWK